MASLLALASGCRPSPPPEGFDEHVKAEVLAAAEASTGRALVPVRGDERWRPESALPRFHVFQRSDVAELERYAGSCDQPHPAAGGLLAKAWAWELHRCSGAPLPEGFFAEAPFMHPDGRSFALHALRCGNRCQQSRDPASFHVVERWEVEPGRFPRVDRAALAAMHAGEPFANVGETIFVRLRGAYVPVETSRLVGASRRVALGRGEVCDARVFGRCWLDRDRQRSSALSRAVAGASAAALSLSLLALGAWRVRFRRRVMAERSFVLRLLAHELRTPVTALKLEVEGLRPGFDDMPPETQDRFLNITREVARLQRIVESSAVFVRTAADRREPPRRVESIRGFVEAVVDEAAGEQAAEVAIDAPDRPAALPTTTASLALRNLVRNALQHGRPPVAVRASLAGPSLVIEVEDGGDLPSAVARSLGQAFAPVGRAGGLGLGLHLAQQALSLAGGQLTVSARPTRFTLSLPAGDP